MWDLCRERQWSAGPDAAGGHRLRYDVLIVDILLLNKSLIFDSLHTVFGFSSGWIITCPLVVLDPVSGGVVVGEGGVALARPRPRNLAQLRGLYLGLHHVHVPAPGGALEAKVPNRS